MTWREIVTQKPPILRAVFEARAAYLRDRFREDFRVVFFAARLAVRFRVVFFAAFLAVRFRGAAFRVVFFEDLRRAGIKFFRYLKGL
jgi:hypothetical protein